VYPGEYMAWFNCTSETSFLALTVTFGGVTILPEKRPFFVLDGAEYKAVFEEQFLLDWAADKLMLNSGTGFRLQFSVQD
jgi:hypothetical protein